MLGGRAQVRLNLMLMVLWQGGQMAQTVVVVGCSRPLDEARARFEPLRVLAESK